MQTAARKTVLSPGTHVICEIHRNRGAGKVISVTDLFGESYADVLFSGGKALTVPTDTLIVLSDVAHSLQNGEFGSTAAFFARNALLRYKANLSESKIAGSANYKIMPLPHQILTVHFILNRFQPRCLIADEVGLGKTIEAILAYQEFKLRKMVKRVLIVVPSGLVLQWHEELLSKFDEQFVIYNKEYIRTLKQSFGTQTNVWNRHDKIIVSIDSVKPLRIDESLSNEEQQRRKWHNTHVTEALSQSGFDLVIIDEAHKLSKRGDGHESARFKLGSILSESVPIFLLLTATPHQGDPDLFHYLLKLVDPVLFASKDRLIPELVQEVCVRNKKRAAVDFDGNRIFKHRLTSVVPVRRSIHENSDELLLYDTVTDYITQFYNLAKRKNDNIQILLLMLYQRILSSSSFALAATLTRRKQVLSEVIADDEFAEEMVDENGDLSIDELLQGAEPLDEAALQEELLFIDNCLKKAEILTKTWADAKFSKLLTVINEVSRREDDPEIKFIIFTEFRATLKAITGYLQRYGYQCSIIHGGLSREERLEQVEKFRTVNQILVSTDAGGEGINLQFCHCLINFDMPYNPARLEQRIGRVDRIGQKHDVLIFNFQLEGTIEDQVRTILEGKLEIIRQQFGEDRFADVLSLLQDEFSFDRIYLEGVAKRKQESMELQDTADKIYNRAKELIEQESLHLPFSKFSQDAKVLVNNELNNIIESLVLNFLAFKKIQVNWYKDETNACYFTDPFACKGYTTIRNAVFYNKEALISEKSELINAEHPLVKNICSYFSQNSEKGICAAVKIKTGGKFSGITGYWFVYQFKVTNNKDREKFALISIFLENDGFCNNRISTYLYNTTKFTYETARTEPAIVPGESIAEKALQEAEVKARDIYLATKMEWISEVEEYEKKSEDYFRIKRNALENIRIDNIRKSKLLQLEREQKDFKDSLLAKKNIVPQLALYQACYMEFA